MEQMVLHKQNGMYDLRPLVNFFANVPDGVYRIEVKKVRKNRSLDQNGWLWGCIYPLLLNALNAAGWEILTVNQVHEFFKQLMAKQTVLNKQTGEIVEIPWSTAEMDTVQFSTYCEALRDYAREYLGVEIPDPNKMWREMQ